MAPTATAVRKRFQASSELPPDDDDMFHLGIMMLARALLIVDALSKSFRVATVAPARFEVDEGERMDEWEANGSDWMNAMTIKQERNVDHFWTTIVRLHFATGGYCRFDHEIKVWSHHRWMWGNFSIFWKKN